MTKTILRRTVTRDSRTVTRDSSLTFLTLAFFLACACSGPAGKAPAAGTPRGWDLLPEILGRIVPPTFPERDFVVTDYGAVGDGVTDCNPAFKRAIAACTKAGGGRVVVPKGTWLTNGPIHLDNNVNFHVTKDAKIMFGTNFDDYLPHVRVRWEGTECYSYSPLVYAYQKTNIALTGKGSLNGQAENSWAMWPLKLKPRTTTNEELRELNHKDVPAEDIKVYAKPTFFEPFECTNVLIEDVTILDYPFWCVHPTFCTNVTIRRLVVDSHNSNNDGIDPDSCTDVLIEDCWLDQSDDCLAIKAGRDNSAWRRGRPCENIVIRNMPSNFEGVAIGSEMSGGVRNVFIYDCDYDDGNILYCKSNLDRGGFIKDIYVKDLNVGKARILRLRNNYHGYRGGNFPTDFRNINIENVHIKQGDDETISCQGVEGALVYDVFIKDVTIDTLEKRPIMHLRHAENVVLDNVVIAGELQPTNPPMMPPEEDEQEGTASIAPRRSGNWSEPSNWETGRDGARLKWAGDDADRLPDDKTDDRVLIGRSRVVPDGVTVILDRDIEGLFEIRVYEESTFVIPDGRTLKVKGPLIVDRTNSVARQLGGTVAVERNLDIDTTTGHFVIKGGSLSCGKLSLNEGMFVVDDSKGKIESINVRGEFRTGDGEGNTTTKFVANKDGVTPIQCQDLNLDAYMGERLIVDVSAYDYTTHGDLVLFAYRGTRKSGFDGGFEKPQAQVKIIGAQADIVYDDDAKQVKLTNFRP
ncbi:MAG: glycoside hydrolase family 28 protein [Phycisphaerales bacterium]|nr:MAG: glycoside hydrolase family 28 protein [Phycisphaerales bacterium]